MEEDTPKIWDTTGTVFIQGPKHSFLSLGGPRHGAWVWCLGRVPKHRNQWQELEGLLFSPQSSQLVYILSFSSQGVVSLFIFPTCPTALDSEPGQTKAWCPGLVSRPSAKAQEPVARSRGQWQEVEGFLFSPQNSHLVHILSFHSQGVVSLFIFPTGLTALDSESVISYMLLSRNH